MATATAPSWEEWTKRFNESVAPNASPNVPATTGGLAQTDLNNVNQIWDPNFGRSETMTNAAENAAAGGWGSGGFAAGQGMKLLDSEKKANFLLGHQILEPYLAREQETNINATNNAARLQQIATEGAAALQRLQLSEAGATARLNAQEAAEAQRQIVAGQQAMQQLTTREAGETGRLRESIGGNLANTIVSGAFRGGTPAGGGTSRVAGMGTGTPGALGVTYNPGVIQYGGTPNEAPREGGAYNPNARGVTTPESPLGATSIDSILRKYGLLPGSLR